MFGSRSGRPSLIGTAARTAVVVKTANAVNNSNDRKQAARAAQAAPQAAPAQLVAGPMVDSPPASGGLTDEGIARLKQLAELHQAGILSEAEFADQKAKILNG